MRMQARDPNHFGSPLIIARCAKQITLTKIQVSVLPTLSMRTVWKFSNFPAIMILREINFG